MRDLMFDIKGRDRTRDAFQSAERNARAFNGELDKVAVGMRMAGTAAKAFAAGIILAAPPAFLNFLRQSVTDINDMAAAAKLAGVSFEAFQELTYAAESSLVPIGSLQTGLREMQLRADELIKTAGGPAKEAFAALGFTAEELAAKLKMPDRLFEEIVDRLKTFDTASRIRISDEIFGGQAGEQFVKLLDTSAGKISDLRLEARNLGGVLDEQMRQRVEEINRGWNQMTTIVGTHLKGAAVDTVNVFIRMGDEFRKLENRQSASIQNSLSDVYQERADLAKQIAESEREIAEVSSGGGGSAGMMRGQLDEMRALDKQLVDRAMQLRTELDRRQGYDKDFVYTPPVKFEPSGVAGEVGGRGAGTRAIEDQVDAYERVMQSLREEQELMGLNSTEQRILTEQRRAGVTAADTQGQSIDTLIRKIEAEAQQFDQLRIQQDALRDSADWAFGMIGDGLLSIADKSESAGDAIKRLGIELALAAAQAALFNEGPLAGLFGKGLGIFAGGGGTSVADPWLGLRANGGPVDPWKSYVVGEKGPEILRMGGQGGHVVSNDNAFGGGTFNLHYSPSISMPNAQRGAGEEVRAVLKEQERNFTANVLKSLREIKTRGLA